MEKIDLRRGRRHVPKRSTMHPQYGFTAQIAFDQQTLLVENQTTALQPGMTAQADIKTGQRRLIEFVLAPLFRASAESMRER